MAMVVAELNIVLPPWVVSLVRVEYMLRIYDIYCAPYAKFWLRYPEDTMLSFEEKSIFQFWPKN